MDIFSRVFGGAISVDWNQHWGFKKSLEGKSGHSFPKRLFPNGQMPVRDLEYPRCRAIGEYYKIMEIRAYSFELGSGWIVRTYQLLDQT